ncbi:MAG: hypothetical protein ACNA8R_14665 [Nitriliruptoraceae bacterium]
MEVTAETSRPFPTATQSAELGERTDAFDAVVERIRYDFFDAGLPPLARVADVLMRRFGVAPGSAGAPALVGLIGSGIRLGFALLATALAGQWAEVPWGRWALILTFFACFDAWFALMSRLAWAREMMEDWTALIPTIDRESDLHDLAVYVRRVQRPSAVVAVGAVVAAVMLASSWFVAPAAFNELPVGSLVLLALLLHDFGGYVVYSGSLVNWAILAREARYDHRLFWPSPADAPEVRKAMAMTTGQGFGAGSWITLFLMLTVALASWASPLVVPLAVGFILIGYLTAFGLALSNRRSIRRIVERIRGQRLATLQHRIEAYGPRFADLSPEESQQLRGLIDLHNLLRDAPTTPTTTHTVLHAAAGLVIPTLMFVVTVFGEVSAERFIDALLP